MLGCLVLGVLQACSAGSDAPAPTGSAGAAGVDGGLVSCAKDARAQVYSPGMTQPGASNLISARLVTIDPAPALVGTNHWVVELRDAAGAPIETTSLTVKPFMPLHGHGASVVPTVVSRGQGTYDIDNVVLFMPGLWQITLSVDAPTHDSAVFTFCVEG